jgi:hypothetical protein
MRFNEISEHFRGRRSYNDYDNNRTGFSKPPREDDEYVNGDQDEVHAQRHHVDEPHDVHINGRKWKSFGSHNHASNVAKKIKGATVHKAISEEATAGATSAANIGTVDAPQLSPGKARGKKSYTGSPSTGSGTKAPPQPKVVQPKNADGTAKNGLDLGNLFGQAKESTVFKRR